jgi:hypothetical protein
MVFMLLSKLSVNRSDDDISTFQALRKSVVGVLPLCDVPEDVEVLFVC